jgi:hypothetical protein
MAMSPEQAWQRIEESELAELGVSAGTGFGKSVGLRIAGKIFAMFNAGELIVKLPRGRVTELIDTGEGRAWGPGTGKVMKEWVAIAPAAVRQWPMLVAQAREFVDPRPTSSSPKV